MKWLTVVVVVLFAPLALAIGVLGWGAGIIAVDLAVAPCEDAHTRRVAAGVQLPEGWSSGIGCNQ